MRSGRARRLRRRYPVLVAIDDYNALYDYSAFEYRNQPSGRGRGDRKGPRAHAVSRVAVPLLRRGGLLAGAGPSLRAGSSARAAQCERGDER